MPRTIYDPRYIETISLLKAARENRGISQADLSRRLGRSQSYIAKIELRERRVDLIETLDLCKALDIKAESIIPPDMRSLLCEQGDKEDNGL
jgi:transcriptional regulator with XRE-family HTH domain